MSIEERISKHLKMYERDLSENHNPIIIMTNEAKVRILKTAPRDLNKLNVEIALKTKAYNNETKFPEREILRVELHALEWLRLTVRIEAG
ncbi:hypothetical protein NTE_01208 [Candidatus Nitrososphaera evergladensis SR1]|uniref:Uncharacterized protein n=1 Tax=Candidatus Nitrososphaera evergladensis SR1 TaxID=1459636 RepID=A0A075MQD0_9ARCH|nr:hypothetical protein [Candidatus Nitrososphaera evergladensis]AIF83280.1 hypothetical protein NTE_01208 [Candidatus Nitrososphaera evergladensis SR1]